MADLKTLNTFYYNEQLKRYMIQFMAIFAGMEVQVGSNETSEPRLIKIPIVNASRDRVAAAIKGENTQNKPLRLPMFSASFVGLTVAPELRKGSGGHRRNAYMPTNGLFPEDVSVVEQRMPVPYKMSVELNIWASNQDQHFQILEQILTLFDPSIQIQTSDDVFDWTRLTIVELRDIRFDETIPPMSDRRYIQTMLTFEFPIYLSVPAEVHKRYVEQIFIRMGLINSNEQIPEEIIQDFDEQGINYELNFSVDDINIG